MRKFLVFVVLFLLVGASPGWAICRVVEDWIDDQAASEVYPVKAGGMILRGIHRIIESPLEIACHTYKGATEELEYGVGILKGFGTGLLWMVDSNLRGAWDIVTFAFPDYYGEPGEHKLECWKGGAGPEATEAEE